MSENKGYDFQVYHGTLSPPDHLKNGLSGHPAYDNVATDPFSSVGWARSSGDGTRRLSIWNVQKSDVRISNRLKSGGINREFTDAEKQIHFDSFKKSQVEEPVDLLRANKPLAERFDDEAARHNGLSPEHLSLIVDFNNQQASYLLKQPDLIQVKIITDADDELGTVSYFEMADEFVSKFPNIKSINVRYEKEISKTPPADLVKRLFAQSVYANCLELMTGDDLNFSQEIIANLDYHKALIKPPSYYSDRNTYRRLRPRIDENCKRIMTEILAYYPEFEKIDSKK